MTFYRTLPILNRRSTAGLGASPWESIELPRGLEYGVVDITVEAVTGNPTGMTITPRFQGWHSVAGGGEFERLVGTSLTPPRFTLTAGSNPFLLPDGDWQPFTNVNPGPNGLSQKKTLRGGFPWGLSLAWSFTGGTNPAALISVTLYAVEGATPTAPPPTV